MKINIRKVLAIACTLSILTTVVYSSSVFTTAQATPETTESIEIEEYNCDTGETREYTFEYDSIDINAPGADEMLTSYSDENVLNNITLEGSAIASPFTLLPGDAAPYRVDATTSPHSKVLFIKTRFPEAEDGKTYWGYGTAFMVAPDVALTAAHNVQQDFLGYATRMHAHKKYQSSIDPETGTQPLRWSLPTNYTQGGDLSYDWCIIKFSGNMGLGYFNYQVPKSNTEVYVNGYPQASEYTYYQYRNGGVFRLCSDGRMFDHSCSTLGGQSGGPAYKTNGTVIGIHTQGQRNSSDSYNHGCIITQGLYNLIEKVKTE